MTASPATATGTSSTTETAALTGLAPGTEYYFQIEAVNSGGTTYGSVLNFTTLAAAPTATTNAATGVTGTGCDPQRLGQRRGSLDDGHLLLQHLEPLANCAGGTVTTVNGSTPTATGSTSTAESAALTGLTPNTDVLLPDQGGQLRRHHLRRGAQLHDHVGPDRHHERGERHHRDGLDPQRLGQRREPLDRGHLLLQHVERLGQLLGRHHVTRQPGDGDGHLEHRRDARR